MTLYGPIRDRLRAGLAAAAATLRAAGFPDDMVVAMTRLAAQVGEPYVLAVVGMAKSGKSSLINALLGADLAKVGVIETTATVNWFRYGRPDPERPVRCYRRGKAEPECHSAAFLDRLQGDDDATLRLGRDIERIEYLLEHELLRDLVLVDTPGHGAVHDDHQDRTAEFIRLQTMLRHQQDADVRHLAREADGLLYVLPPQWREGDRAFLEEFHNACPHRPAASDTVVILGRLDAFDTDLVRASQRATDFMGHVAGLANSVIPVAAGIHRLVERYQSQARVRDDFVRFIHDTDDDAFDLMTESFACLVDVPHASLTIDQRVSLVGNSPWPSFQAAALYARQHRGEAIERILSELKHLAGVERLRGTIECTFVASGALLRCYRITQNAEMILADRGYDYLDECRTHDDGLRSVEQRYLKVLQRLAPAALLQDAETVKDLAAFVVQQTQRDRKTQASTAVLNQLSASFAELRMLLEYRIEDVQLAQFSSDYPQLFSGHEAAELKSLLVDPDGSFWPAVNHLPELRRRQSLWNDRAMTESDRTLRTIATLAASVYGRYYLAALKQSKRA